MAERDELVQVIVDAWHEAGWLRATSTHAPPLAWIAVNALAAAGVNLDQPGTVVDIRDASSTDVAGTR